MKKYIPLHRAICGVMILLVLLSGCSGYPSDDLTGGNRETEKHSFDWTMYGIVVDSVGNPVNYAHYYLEDFSVSCTIDPQKDNSAEMTLRIVLPESFQYMFEKASEPDATTEYYSNNRKFTDEPYYVMHSYSYDRRANESVFTNIGLCTQKEYMIFNWEDGEDLYLVASTDPNTEPNDILQYFRIFREMYAIDD